ncbi:unnamed protein product [Cyclocybe aegerita]|uniref:Uncharacterized protein n=1 Tax=Cyclocybe aegerita TaxID=1973307 RepID=A0A8S0WCU3_CYCAE|nr:unnamed protein product [Cyclocybe aegerita]
MPRARLRKKYPGDVQAQFSWSHPFHISVDNSSNSSKHLNISYDTYVKAILCPASEELKEFSERVTKDTCSNCSRKHTQCLPDDADHLRCKACQDLKQGCSWKKDFILKYTMKDLGLSSEEARKRHLLIDYRSIRPNRDALSELEEERERRERERETVELTQPSPDNRKRKRPLSVSVTSLVTTGGPPGTSVIRRELTSPGSFAASLEKEGSPSKRPKHGEDAAKARHNQEGVQETIASTSRLDSSRPSKFSKMKSKLNRVSLFGALPSRPSSKPVEAPSSVGPLETPLLKSYPIVHLLSHASAQNRDDGTQNRDRITRNPQPVHMFLPLSSSSAPAREPATAATSTPTPAVTQISPTEVATTNAPVSEEQHKEAMEIVLKKALEDQIAAKSALARSEEDNRRQAEEMKEMRQTLEAMKKEKTQLKSELDLKKMECGAWKTKADKFERLATKYSDDAAKLLKGFSSEMGLASEHTASKKATFGFWRRFGVLGHRKAECPHIRKIGGCAKMRLELGVPTRSPAQFASTRLPSRSSEILLTSNLLPLRDCPVELRRQRFFDIMARSSSTHKRRSTKTTGVPNPGSAAMAEASGTTPDSVPASTVMTVDEMKQKISHLPEARAHQVLNKVLDRVPAAREVLSELSSNPVATLPLSEWAGIYKVRSPELADEWPKECSGNLKFETYPSSTSAHLWAHFNVGIISGVMRSISKPPTAVNEEILIEWRGRELGEQAMLVNEWNRGILVFLGEGKIQATIQGDEANYTFTGSLVPPGDQRTLVQQKRRVKAWKSEWRRYNWANEDAEQRARIGRKVVLYLEESPFESDTSTGDHRREEAIDTAHFLMDDS